MEHGKTNKANENPLDILDWDEFDYMTPGIDVEVATRSDSYRF